MGLSLRVEWTKISPSTQKQLKLSRTAERENGPSVRHNLSTLLIVWLRPLAEARSGSKIRR